MDLVKSVPLLLLVGVSGAGKDTIISELLKRGTNYRVVSHTTRKPRVNNGALERYGVDYQFVDREHAEGMLKRGEFIEATLYSGNIYGTSVAELEAAQHGQKIALCDIEVQGVSEYVAIDPNVRAVFVLPPDYETWQRRLRHRSGGAMDREEFEKRMRTALHELEHALNSSHYMFVVNDSLDRVVDEVDQLMHGEARPGELMSALSVARVLREELERAHPLFIA